MKVKPATYTKTRRRLLTKYARRIERALKTAKRPTEIRMSRHTFSFLKFASDFAPWVTLPARAMRIRWETDDSLRRGRFRVVEAASG